MSAPLILLHEDALSAAHPVFAAAPQGSRALFIWDDAYWQAGGYSLKRLIFIYETLCELPVDILHGDTPAVLAQLAPPALYVPTPRSPAAVQLVAEIEKRHTLHRISEAPFATIKKTADFRRFFQYWSKAEKTAFLPGGGANA
jgi:hypothetical protein